MKNKLKEKRYSRMMTASELSRRSGISRETICGRSIGNFLPKWGN